MFTFLVKVQLGCKAAAGCAGCRRGSNLVERQRRLWFGVFLK